MTTSEREGVAALEKLLVQRVGKNRYDLWFARHAKFRREDDLLTVGVPNLHFQDWLQTRFGEDIQQAASSAFETPMHVRFAIDGELFRAARKEQEECAFTNTDRTNKFSTTPVEHQVREKTREASQPKNHAPLGEEGHFARGKRGRRWHRLSDFVVGPCNRVAHASAQSVLEAPGQEANPLVWHGPAGTGKTHLLESVYAGLRKARPDWRVVYVTAEDFTNRFVQAMRLGKLLAFRKHFRECDALLIDDLHFLASKRATQEEFQHTLDFLQRDGKQLIATFDCHPRLTEDLAPELVDRLLGGVSWGLTPPDAGTRLNILKTKSSSLGLIMAEPVLRHLAETLRGNVRELEGALNSLKHYSLVTKRCVDLGLVREALADLLRHSLRVVQLADIDATVCRILQLPGGSLQSSARNWMVSHPRMLAMLLARKHTAAAYSEVGRYFGGRTHSTAVAAEKKVRQWMRDRESMTVGDQRIPVCEVIELVERELLR